MESKLTTGLRICIALITLSSLTYFIDITIFERVSKEDGELENLTALVLFTCSALLFVRLTKVYKTKNSLWITVNIIMRFLNSLIINFPFHCHWQVLSDYGTIKATVAVEIPTPPPHPSDSGKYPSLSSLFETL